MKSLFSVMLISLTSQVFSKEIVELSKPSASNQAEPNIFAKFMDAVREKIPEELHFPDVAYQGGSKFVCSSMSFRLFDSTATGPRDFYYSYETKLKAIIPKLYTFRFSVQANSNYEINCSPWLNNQGPLNVSVENLEFRGNIVSSLSPPRIRFTSMTAHVDAINFTINGILNNTDASSLISMILTDRITYLINGNQVAISNQLMKDINDMMEHVLPGSEDLEEKNDVDLSKYTEEQLKEESRVINAALKEVMKQLDSVFAYFPILS